MRLGVQLSTTLTQLQRLPSTVFEPRFDATPITTTAALASDLASIDSPPGTDAPNQQERHSSTLHRITASATTDREIEAEKHAALATLRDDLLRTPATQDHDNLTLL
jgi:hypothetical protein